MDLGFGHLVIYDPVKKDVFINFALLFFFSCVVIIIPSIHGTLYLRLTDGRCLILGDHAVLF